MDPIKNRQRKNVAVSEGWSGAVNSLKASDKHFAAQVREWKENLSTELRVHKGKRKGYIATKVRVHKSKRRGNIATKLRVYERKRKGNLCNKAYNSQGKKEREHCSKA